MTPKPFVKALGKKFVEHIHEIAIAVLVDIEKFSVERVLLVAGAVLFLLGLSIVLMKEGGASAAPLAADIAGAI